MQKKQSRVKYLVAIDPGSNNLGLTVWTLEGEYKACKTFKPNASWVVSRRLRFIGEKFKEWWQEHFPDGEIVECVVEALPPNQFTISLQISPAMIISQVFCKARCLPEYLVAPNQWKAFCKEMKAGKPPYKGRMTLNEMGWEYETLDSDDSADSALIFLTYSWNRKGYVKLSNDKMIVNPRFKRIYYKGKFIEP